MYTSRTKIIEFYNEKWNFKVCNNQDIINNEFYKKVYENMYIIFDENNKKDSYENNIDITTLVRNEIDINEFLQQTNGYFIDENLNEYYKTQLRIDNDKCKNYNYDINYKTEIKKMQNDKKVQNSR